MKKLTIKEILEMKSETLESIMTENQLSKMQELGMENTWELLDALKDGAKLSELSDEEEFITIDEYLEYLEDLNN